MSEDRQNERMVFTNLTLNEKADLLECYLLGEFEGEKVGKHNMAEVAERCLGDSSQSRLVSLVHRFCGFGGQNPQLYKENCAFKKNMDIRSPVTTLRIFCVNIQMESLTLTFHPKRGIKVIKN